MLSSAPSTIMFRLNRRLLMFCFGIAFMLAINLVWMVRSSLMREDEQLYQFSTTLKTKVIDRKAIGFRAI